MNEFVIKNGFISKGNSIVEGGFTATTISASTYSNLPSPSITVGTSQLTSGTDTRVLFQSGTTLQQDSNFSYNTTQKRLILQANGATVTNIPLQILNSTGSANLVEIAGNNTFTFLSTPGKAVLSNVSNGGPLLTFGRDYTNQEVVRISGNDYPSISLTKLNTTSSISIGTVANGISMNYNAATGDDSFQIQNSFHNVFQVIGNPNSASASFRLGSISSNANFFNLYGPNGGGTGINATQLFNVNTNGNVGIGMVTTGARLDVRSPGATSANIAFRVRNSADTADLISFRGDGSQWIQSVPFIHAAFATGTNNANQGILLGYNVASLSTTSLNCVVIGRGSGAILQGNGNTIIGDGFTQGTFTNSIGLGRGVFVSNSNHFFCGSDSFPVNTWWVSTGGEASSGANLRGLDFRVSGMAGGPGNISAAAHPVRFFSPNGTGNGAGSNIQFHVAPSNTGGAFFNRNIFSEMFTIRGEADGLNHYQLSTPRVPSASITDGYIQYSNDITAGNAAPHFRTENGAIVKVYQETTGVTTSTLVSNAGTNITDTDTFDGYTLQQVVKALRNLGILQ